MRCTQGTDQMIKVDILVLGCGAIWAGSAEVVSGSLIWREGTSPFAQHLWAMTRWDDNGKIGYPPYLALLAVLALAAESMVTDARYASHNYHDRLAPLLGLDSYCVERLRRHFPETVRFWHSLNDWLEDWEGDLVH